VVVRALIT